MRVSCHREIETFLSRGDSFLAARLTASLALAKSQHWPFLVTLLFCIFLSEMDNAKKTFCVADVKTTRSYFIGPSSFQVFLLRYLRLDQWKDDQVKGWLNHFIVITLYQQQYIIHVTSFFSTTYYVTWDWHQRLIGRTFPVYSTRDPCFTSIEFPPPCVVVRNIHSSFPKNKFPHLGVPYPLTNGGQQLRHASGRCPRHNLSVTYMLTLQAL